MERFPDDQEAMMGRPRWRLSYANVVATLALVIAVAGGATAAAGGFKAPKNSVTSKSIRAGNVTASDLTRIETVTAQREFSDAQPPDGIYAQGSAVASCRPGTRIISGSAAISGTKASFLTSSQQVGQGWGASGNTDGEGNVTLTAIANCLATKPAKQ
jgi:hypothetical protein